MDLKVERTENGVTVEMGLAECILLCRALLGFRKNVQQARELGVLASVEEDELVRSSSRLLRELGEVCHYKHLD